MVPVMTLAVCAIAMVGLGFALTTSVTTEKNVVGKLMVDISSSTEPSDWKEPVDENDISNLLSFGIQSVKKKDTLDPTKYVVSKYLVSKDAKLKIFGNMTDLTLKVSVKGMAATTETKKEVSEMTITITGTGENSAFTATAELVQSNNYTAIFGQTGGTCTLSSNEVYKVQVTKINGVDIGELDSSEETTLGNISGINLDFTFTATSDNAKPNSAS